MAKVIINQAELKKVMSPAVLKKIEKQIIPDIEQQIQKANKELLEEFLSNEITQEIRQGKSASNISGTLGGKGNLFSFLGFESGSNPIEELASFLSNCIKIQTIKKSVKDYSITITISVPSLSDLDDLAELPWINKSWIRAIETGISGLGYYLYSEYGFENSRSGTAIQSNKKISQGGFKPQKYMSNILKNISKKLIQDIKNNF